MTRPCPPWTIASPDGLSWAELTTVLRAGLSSGHTLGLDVTIFNPLLDSDGRLARALVDALVAGLSL
jgi:arginase